jgi:putative Holliday junction resolvase
MATNNAKFLRISELIEEWEPSICVVGLPTHPDGVEHRMTTRCRRFANQLHGRYNNINVILVDERYSSAVVPHRRGEMIDSQSAAIILQQYFDNQF